VDPLPLKKRGSIAICESPQCTEVNVSCNGMSTNADFQSLFHFLNGRRMLFIYVCDNLCNFLYSECILNRF
jgi:hypothetical protein